MSCSERETGNHALRLTSLSRSTFTQISWGYPNYDTSENSSNTGMPSLFNIPKLTSWDTAGNSADSMDQSLLEKFKITPQYMLKKRKDHAVFEKVHHSKLSVQYTPLLGICVTSVLCLFYDPAQSLPGTFILSHPLTVIFIGDYLPLHAVLTIHFIILGQFTNSTEQSPF